MITLTLSQYSPLMDTSPHTEISPHLDNSPQAQTKKESPRILLTWFSEMQIKLNGFRSPHFISNPVYKIQVENPESMNKVALACCR